MMMDPVQHPDDERLSAFAAGDEDQRRDSTLRAHVESCERCHPIVDELRLMVGHLRAMPDLAPPRPIRIVLPERRSAAHGGLVELVRRLFAPALAAGATLALVGAVGLGAQSGVFGQASSPAGGEPASVERAPAAAPSAAAEESIAAADAGGTGQVTVGSEAPRDSRDSLAAEPTGRPFSAEEFAQSASPEPATSNLDSGEGGTQWPWLPLFVGGVALAALALFLRFALLPRAG
jgi:hypothetical protein